MTEIHFVFRISRIIVLLFFSVRTGALFLLRTCYVISWFENAASSASVNSSLTGGFLQFLQILQFYSFFFIVFYCFVCQIALLSLRRFFCQSESPVFIVRSKRTDQIIQKTLSSLLTQVSPSGVPKLISVSKILYCNYREFLIKTLDKKISFRFWSVFCQYVTKVQVSKDLLTQDHIRILPKTDLHLQLTH